LRPAGRASSSQDLRGDEDTEKATQTTMATWMRVRKFARAEDGYAKLLLMQSCFTKLLEDDFSCFAKIR
jgi:hypothetical protein